MTLKADRETRNLFDPLSGDVGFILMQHEFRRTPVRISLECDLRVDDLQEIIALALRKHLKLRLSGRLHEQVTAFARHGEDEVGRQLVTADVALEQFRVDGNLLVNFWRAGGRLAFEPPGRHILTVLVQNQLGRAALIIGLESYLGVDDFVEVFTIAFRKYLGLALSGRLYKQVVAFAGHGEDEVWSQLVLANIAIEQIRIDGDFLAFLRRPYLYQGALGIEQVQADIVDAGSGEGIRQHDNANARSPRKTGSPSTFDSTTTPMRAFGS